MAKRVPNHKKLVLVLSAAFIVMTLLMGVLALLVNQFSDKTDEPSSSDVQITASGDEPNSTSSQDTSSAEEMDVSSQASSTGDVSAPPDSSSEDADQQSEENSSDGQTSADETGEPDEEEGQKSDPVFFNKPDVMRAVMISAGSDYMTSADTSKATVAGEIDRALNSAKELTMNTIIIDTKYKDSVLFNADALNKAAVELDCTDYIVTKARELGFYVYATYDVTDLMGNDGQYLRAASVDGDTIDDVMINIGEFATKYELDGILLNNYYNTAGGGSYAQYLANGGGIGYGNYMKQVPQALITAAASSARQQAPGTQVGLLADAVWENSAVNQDGPETQSEFTALSGGNTDTRALVQDGLFDFVMVKNFGSTNEKAANFGTVAKWWSQLTQDAGVTLYMMHAADRVGTQSTGWTVYEQLTKQVIDLEAISGISGSAFNSLKALNANPGNSTTTLIQYMNDEIDQSWVLTQLAVTKPAQMTFTTKEATVTFQGASDPQAEVTINGDKIPTNESGYFTIKEDLKAGLNTFSITHKSKTFTYNITREVQVLKEIMPTGSITVDGGMEVLVSALAYEGSTVTASINGQTVQLVLSDTEGDDTDRESGYKLYTGVFTAPSASSSAVGLGNIVVTGTSADGISQSLTGAAVTVNKKAVMGDGAIIQITADQAETFPVNTLNDNSAPGYYPLPKGTVDKAYGDQVVYKDGKKTKTYWKLESGVRVYSTDITTGGQMPDNNAITDLSVKSSGAYTLVTLSTGSKVPYIVDYNGNSIVFKFQYTSKVPETDSIKDNALFKSAEWSGSNLTLNLKRSGGFLGYKAYYDEAGRLVFRFNNSPGGLSGARIVIDPGHGGNDPGALGFYPGKDEADINLEIAKKLVSELKGRGASVLMTTPGSTMANRLASARAFNAQVLVSLHCNSSPNSEATGSEVYYFYPFQKQLAANISSTVSSILGSDNRGAKTGLYYMTRESQFSAVLAEMGFVSNESEYTKLIKSKTQSRIAEGIADAVSGYLGGVGSGGSYEEDDSGDDVQDSEEDGDEEEESKGNEDVSGVVLNKDFIELKEGDTLKLKAEVEPSDARNKKVYWESDDEDVAKVSSSGKVTAKSEGTAWITVTTDDGEYSAECEVSVIAADEAAEEGVLVEEISIEGDDMIAVGTRKEYTAESYPSNAQDGGIRFKSSDTDIAIVTQVDDYTCKIEGVSEGTFDLICTAYDDSGVVEEMEITVES